LSPGGARVDKDRIGVGGKQGTNKEKKTIKTKNSMEKGGERDVLFQTQIYLSMYPFVYLFLLVFLCKLLHLSFPFPFSCSSFFLFSFFLSSSSSSSFYFFFIFKKGIVISLVVTISDRQLR
jgi:hypothetical protein